MNSLWMKHKKKSVDAEELVFLFSFFFFFGTNFLSSLIMFTVSTES